MNEGYKARELLWPVTASSDALQVVDNRYERHSERDSLSFLDKGEAQVLQQKKEKLLEVKGGTSGQSLPLPDDEPR